jgi:cell wall-associated NlpC family hydrolase
LSSTARFGATRRPVLRVGIVVGSIVVLALGHGRTGGTEQVIVRLADPPRSEVSVGGAWQATFTDGARSVALRGPIRSWGETTTPERVTSNTWVRLLPQPFDGHVDEAWLASALADRTPDLLETAMEYVRGAPPILDGSGLQIAGDADYGPLKRNGMRSEGSDFNDYLGIPWKYPDGTLEQPDPQRRADVDCSGYVRMVFGYRLGLALGLDPDGGASLPRQSFRQAASAPGIVLIPDLGARAEASGLQPGDLLFFDADSGDGTQIDHVGIYLGLDSGGHERFVSSRKTANGPTLGDLGGRSVLDGEGLYAESFREARRI